MNIEFNTTEDLEDKTRVFIDASWYTIDKVNMTVKYPVSLAHVVIFLIQEKSKLKKRNVYRTY